MNEHHRLVPVVRAGIPVEGMARVGVRNSCFREIDEGEGVPPYSAVAMPGEVGPEIGQRKNDL